MKKTLRRLRLERETLRNLTPDHLEQVVGGTNTSIGGDTRYNSCNFSETHPYSICNSCNPLGCV